jgi:pimeloyl-ACP methyl ester carboxylesterase
MRDEEYLSMTKSTIVRSQPRPIPLLRVAGALLSTVAPAQAAKLAAHLFLTPPRPSRPVHEASLLSTARTQAIEVGGRRVQTWTFGHGPTVLLVHGWGGRGSQLAAFVAPLLARGFSVTTFDAPAHGDSGGRQATLPEMVAALRAVAAAAAHAPIHGIVAHSIGAVVAARAVYEGLAPGALVFLGPPAELHTPALAFAEAFGLSRRVRELMQQRIEQHAGVTWEAFDVTRLALSQTAPLRVIHDRDDGEVPWQLGAVIARTWRGAELVMTGGLGHRRILRDPSVVETAVSFIAAHAFSRHLPPPRNRLRGRSPRSNTCSRIRVLGRQ